jgi:Glycosyl transferase family 2
LSSPLATKISVIIPVYERVTTLQRAISSVRAQPGIDPEIIVVDDGSSNPRELVEAAGANVRVIRNPVNQGAGPARNLGVANASHDVLAFLDSDDEWALDSARERLALLGPGTCVVGGHTLVNEPAHSTRFVALPRNLAETLRIRNPVAPSTIFIRRVEFDRAGGFPCDRACAEDWVFLLRVVAAGIEIRTYDHAAATVHIDGANTTLRTDVLVKHAVGAVMHMQSEHLVNGRELMQVESVVAARVAGFYANAGRIFAATDCLRRAVTGLPDRHLARELLYVPVLAARGAARRRWRTIPTDTEISGGSPSFERQIVVVVGNPRPAWVSSVIDKLKMIAPTIAIEHSDVAEPLPSQAVASWRVRRAKEDNAMAARLTVTTCVIDLAHLRYETGLVVDLSGNETYRPQWPGDSPVIRVRFGRWGSLQPERGFAHALLIGQHLDRVDITLEWNDRAAVLRSAPVVVNDGSGALTRNGALWKASATLPRAVSAALAGNAKLECHRFRRTRIPGERWVAAATTATRFGISITRGTVARDRWNIGIQPFQPSVPSTATLSQTPTIWLDEPTSVADPCLFELDGCTYLFAERELAGRPGRIAASRVRRDGTVAPLADVLVEDHHLSYPTVLRDENGIWLVPESSSARNVQLYQADEFPHRWSRAAVLLDGLFALDPTLHRNEDGWWMFACVAPYGRGRNDELCLFHSRRLTGPWRAHPANPILDDPRRARPAGGLFMADGRLVRPSQDCSERYGRRIYLNEVVELSDTRYRERPIATIDPDWHDGLIATHTISRSGNWQAVDGARRVIALRFPRQGARN